MLAARSARGRAVGLAHRITVFLLAAASAGGLMSSSAAATSATDPGAALRAPAALSACMIAGVENQALCGVVRRPLDPARPNGKVIDVHYAVLPAIARNKRPDPVFFVAGGPGQSAIDVAGTVQRMLPRIGNHRDIVLVDQRGTGRSAPLMCEPDDPWRPLADMVDTNLAATRLKACAARLQTLPHGDLRQYTTTIAMADLDAVREAIGAPVINLVGASYGTRAILEYMRLYPQRVRTAVIDGVAPADMVLPESASQDNQAALEAMFEACAADQHCRARHPDLRARWHGLIESLPRSITVRHPARLTPETFTLTREAAVSTLRGPLYAPALAAVIPEAIEAAAAGRFEPLMALASSLGGSKAMRMSAGMHFAVICNEDAQRMGRPGAMSGRDFGDSFARVYAQACSAWPRADAAPDFYRIVPTSSPTLVLSGGIDPVTPPRHGERVTASLGPKARHVVVPQAGHGVMSYPCMREVLHRFINEAGGAEASGDKPALDPTCAAKVPRATAYQHPQPVTKAP
jgi:pimeloyl-ACP methyl ester carboxylesterase